MPLQSTVPFMVITTIITLVGGVLPLAHYVIAGEVRATRGVARAPARVGRWPVDPTLNRADPVRRTRPCRAAAAYDDR
jgi:hypothetical protein